MHVHSSLVFVVDYKFKLKSEVQSLLKSCSRVISESIGRESCKAAQTFRYVDWVLTKMHHL